ncbi:deoxyuridine 5'-triphosphate nucleotidohydrolase [Candidatus Kaiserbacteria bacterium RIFOXYD1_FULL_42_15]|uniref:dUTP diphosphatase n=1 Tax=Candidatus Kaiserbacteria bacterium RIFOXYD1_FULL_42_15 TaxID=1798532 RepID=A0A1F6FPQ8_9BACT|nr:MAG: deoxyuridine 5'-triphosphate nucleotidohydrolase [Candidatus Kaiserbacteria bacterium RIFOXYD1_FULL_42_15]
MQLPVKKLHPVATIPQYAHHNDAGMDLFSVSEITIQPQERVSVPTGIAMQIPDGYVGLIWDKSGISQKFGLKTLGGVVDAGYRGEIFVGLYNTGDNPHTFEAGQKLAQIIIQKIEQPEVIEVLELGDSIRGEGAFGSTGK